MIMKIMMITVIMMIIVHTHWKETDVLLVSNQQIRNELAKQVFLIQKKFRVKTTGYLIPRKLVPDHIPNWLI